MENILRPVAQSCAVSGTRFEPGKTVISILCIDSHGTYQRFDCAEGCEQQLESVHREVCRWRVRIIAPDVSATEKRKEANRSAAELFFALSEKAEDSELTEEEKLLINFLALHLERQRILRGVGSASGQYLHIREKKIFTLPKCKWDAKLIAGMTAHLGPLAKS
ncbi:MAG: hypothetical protein LR015_14695 [Verrucomicrobia bacterium]|nr:hypothetical protein [Verrucomicrobiota bacterium]